MKSWFLKRGYPKNMIDEELKKFKFSGKGSRKSKGSIIKDNLNILYMSREAKAVFSPET